jgi:hypothetical protein
MATKFITPSWRMPKNSNQSKASNYSLDFDGALNSEILLGNSTHLLPGQPSSTSTSVSNPKFSVSIFFQFKSSALGALQWMVGSGQEGGATYWALAKDANNNLQSTFRITNGAYATITGGTTLSHSTWYHACVTWDGNNINLYLNGTLDATQVAATTFYYGSTISHPTIGSFRYGGGNNTNYRFQGKLTQVSIFDYGLDSNAVATLWGGGIPGNPLAIKPPVAYYDLGQGSAYAEGSAGIVEPNLAQATGSTVFDFDGTDIILADPIIFTGLINSIDGAISISSWFKTTASGDILVGRTRTTAAPFNNPWILYTDNSNVGKLGWTLNNTNGDVLEIRLTGTTDPQGDPLILINDGSFHNVVATYDGSNTSALYIDGVLQKTVTVADFGNYPIPTAYPAGRTCIGGTQNSSGGWPNGVLPSFVGEVSNVQIWNTKIESSEVTTLYNYGVPLMTGTQPQAANLKGWYKLGLDTSNWDGSNWIIGNSTANYSTALDLDGDNDYINLSNSSLASSLSGLTQFTLSLWYNQDAVSNKFLFDFKDGTNRIAFQLVNASTNFLYFNSSNNAYSASDTPTQQWNNFVLVFDGSQANADRIKVYINNSKITASSTGTIDAALGSFSASSIFNLGATHAATQTFNGIVSNLSLFNTDLNPTDLYNNGTPQASILGSPLAWWKLDNTTITDSSNNGYTGTNVGATQVSSLVSTPNGLSSGMDTTNLVPSNLIKSIPYSGYSMLFDLADDDSINCGTDTSLNILSDLSISIWFKTTSSGLHTLINRDQGSGNRIWNISISEQAGQPYIAATFRGDVDKTVSDQVNVNDGNWHNVIAVYDPSTFIKLYVDGVLEGTDSTGIPSSLTDASSVPLYIGAYSNFGSENFDGQLSNASIFNKILTEDEILRVYNGGSPGDLVNLGPTSWWSLGADSYFNGSNWICPDIGANSNNGTSANMGAVNLLGIGPDSLANGTSTNLDLASDLIGEAPGSIGNAISINMNSLARTGSTP